MATYDDVNTAWKAVLPLPPITMADSTRIYLKLRRHFGAPYKGRAPISPRRVWASTVGSARPLSTGLPRMVHSASHRVFSILHPTLKTHSGVHAELELRMIQYVIDKGLHLSKPGKPAPTLDDKRAQRLAQTEASIKRWQTKAKRAATALKKLNARKKRLLATMN